MQGASGETYEELCGRVLAADARLAELEGEQRATIGRKEAVASARELVNHLKKSLGLSDGVADVAWGRWLYGYGYINAWREVHQVEDVLLAVEPKEVVYATAVTNLDRLAGSSAGKKETRLTAKLAALVDENGTATKAAGHEDVMTAVLELSEPRIVRIGLSDAAEPDVVARFEEDKNRVLVRESAYRIHRAQNDAWDKIVNLRNRLLLTFTVTVTLTYGMVVLVVLRPGDMTTQLTAAAAFFLTGAAVGVFRELWDTSRLRTGTVFDYGLAQVRLLATPVLSGLAALGGVLVTNVAGSYLIERATTASQGATTTTSTPPTLDQVFSLDKYQMGLIVAAIFGLTPGLFLERLHARQDQYEKQITELVPAKGADDPSSATTAGAAAV